MLANSGACDVHVPCMFFRTSDVRCAVRCCRLFKSQNSRTFLSFHHVSLNSQASRLGINQDSVFVKVQGVQGDITYEFIVSCPIGLTRCSVVMFSASFSVSIRISVAIFRSNEEHDAVCAETWNVINNGRPLKLERLCMR